MPFASYSPVAPSRGPSSAEIAEFAARAPHLDFRAARERAERDDRNRERQARRQRLRARLERIDRSEPPR